MLEMNLEAVFVNGQASVFYYYYSPAIIFLMLIIRNNRVQNIEELILPKGSIMLFEIRLVQNELSTNKYTFRKLIAR